MKRWLKSLSATTTFCINLSVVISLVLAAIYLGFYLRNTELIRMTVYKQAVSYFDLIVKARKWNAAYGGVYVEKKGNVVSNPYLRQVGVEPDVPTQDGRVMTLRNPALMTREISELLGNATGTRFHITSLRPLNPHNTPDAFEQNALHRFEQGEKEANTIEQTDQGTFFRYMAPLMTDESCLRCHAGAGYKVGDVRGGISVNIPYDDILKQQAQTRIVIIALSITTVVLLLGATFLIVAAYTRKIREAQEDLRLLSITDVLTGIRNRRYAMERLEEEFHRARRAGTPLGVLMLDLDHFKSINDTHGHSVGDATLRAFAETLRANVRDYDIPARYGGEEFIVIAPNTAHADLLRLAERIKDQVAAQRVSHGSATIAVTTSIGLGTLQDSDKDVDALLGRVDKALYQAKYGGRNRIVADA